MMQRMTNITDTVFLGPPESDILDLIDFNIPYVRIVTCILAVLTNILVVITVAKSWKSWKYSTHLLILTLALVDIAYNGLELGKEILRLVPDYIIRPNIFTFLMTAGIAGLALLGISNYMMILISLNRYVLVCKPFSHHRITSRRSTLKQIIAMSTILTLLGLLQLVNIFHMHGYCTTLIINAVSNVFISHIVPLTVSVVLTILVICEFRQNRSTLNESMNTRRERQGEKNITKAMIAVNVAFVLLTMPYNIINTVYMRLICLSEYNIFFTLITVYRVLLTWRNINFSVNIFIYAAYIPKFRAALSNLVKCKCRDQNNGRRDTPARNQSQNIRRNRNFQITAL